MKECSFPLLGCACQIASITAYIQCFTCILYRREGWRGRYCIHSGSSMRKPINAAEAPTTINATTNIFEISDGKLLATKDDHIATIQVMIPKAKLGQANQKPKNSQSDSLQEWEIVNCSAESRRSGCEERFLGAREMETYPMTAKVRCQRFTVKSLGFCVQILPTSSLGQV